MELITVTDKAAAQLKEVMAKNNTVGHGVRVRVRAGGCSGFEYQLDIEPTASETDRVVESNGIKIFIDVKSAMLLTGSKIDYDDSLFGGGFRFLNPNAAGSCGCGKSFSA